MDWELAERSKKCLSCGKEFIVGDHYNTALLFDEKKITEIIPLDKIQGQVSQTPENPLRNTAQRLEFCSECWANNVKVKPHDCEWEGAFIDPSVEKKRLFKFNKEDTLTLFKEYMSKTPINNEELIEINGIAYFLAIMLERKNVLSYKKDITDESTGAKCALYMESKTGESFTIHYPLLSKETMEIFKNKICDLLNVPC